MLKSLRVEMGEPIKVYGSNPMREDGGWNQQGGSRNGEKQPDLAIL